MTRRRCGRRRLHANDRRCHGHSNAPEGQDKPEPGVASDEPLAEWEQNLLVNGEAVAQSAEPAAQEPAQEPAQQQA